VTGSDEGTARLWDLRAPRPAATSRELAGHDFKVVQLAIAANNRWLVTSDQRSVRLWNLHAANPAAASALLRLSQEDAGAMLMSPDSRWLILREPDKTLRCWDLARKD
jgi:WD40 repeat protein